MLLDTSGLFCFLYAEESRHQEAVSLLNSAAVRLTYNYVLAELVPLCSARGMNRQVTLEFVDALTNNPNVTIAWVGQEDHRLAMELLRARPDKDYSLCDAVSFLLMRQHGETEALTTDHHFEREGFVRLLR